MYPKKLHKAGTGNLHGSPCTIVTPIYCVCTLQTKLYWHWTFCRFPLKSITKLPITLKLTRNSCWEIWWKWFLKKKQTNASQIQPNTNAQAWYLGKIYDTSEDLKNTNCKYASSIYCKINYHCIKPEIQTKLKNWHHPTRLCGSIFGKLKFSYAKELIHIFLKMGEMPILSWIQNGVNII